MLSLEALRRNGAGQEALMYFPILKFYALHSLGQMDKLCQTVLKKLEEWKKVMKCQFVTRSIPVRLLTVRLRVMEQSGV